MYHTIGFRRDQITELCVLVHTAWTETDDRGRHLRPPVLGLFRSVAVTLTYPRRNRVRAELAEAHNVSQSTISRAISSITPLLDAALREWVPTADEMDPHTQYLFDGTPLPCWSWRSHPQFYSGKHKTTGMNVQVGANLRGQLVWISDPIDGCHHDMYRIRESGVLDGIDCANSLGDKGFQGSGLITPIKKPAGRSLLPWEREFNSVVNSARTLIEQVIANFKTWRIVHTDYRRPIETFTETISAVVALHFYKIANE